MGLCPSPDLFIYYFSTIGSTLLGDSRIYKKQLFNFDVMITFNSNIGKVLDRSSGEKKYKNTNL